MPKNKQKRDKKARQKMAVNRSPDAGATYANLPMGDRHISLRGFLQKQLPDMTPIRMVYSDYRTLTAAGSQANYVYKINSCFDPDFTGVGGQPDGFDQWKTLYQQYRVMACEVEVHAVALAGAALVTVTPSVSSTLSSSAEENIGLRRARGALSNVGGQVAKIRMLARTSDIFGVPDSSVLNNDNYASSITGSPSSAVYARIECETSGATDAVQVWVVLTMYTRFEKPFDTVDSLARRANDTPVGPPRLLSADIPAAAAAKPDCDRSIALAAARVELAKAELETYLNARSTPGTVVLAPK